MGSLLREDDDDGSTMLEETPDDDDDDGIESTPVLCSAITISLMFLIISVSWILLNHLPSSFKGAISYEEVEAMGPLLQVDDDRSMVLEETKALI